MNGVASLVSELQLFIDNRHVVLCVYSKIVVNKSHAFKNSSLATVNQLLAQGGVSQLHAQFGVEGSWQPKDKHQETLCSGSSSYQFIHNALGRYSLSFSIVVWYTCWLKLSCRVTLP